MSDDKRKRVKQACDYCRSKKAKCDGKQPSCLTCIRNNIKCTYPQSKKRGLKTGYIQRLENKVFVLEAILGSLVSKQQLDTDIGALLKDHKFLGWVHEYQDAWENSSLSEVLEEVINQRIAGEIVPKTEEAERAKVEPVSKQESFSLAKKDDDWRPESLQFHGLTTLVSGFNPRDIQTFDAMTKKVSPFRVASIFHVKSDTNATVPPHILSFPPDSRTSVDIYFQVVHPWLPMLNRIQVIRYIHRNTEINQKNLPFARDFNTMALTWTILANSQYIREVTGQESGSGRTASRKVHELSRKYANNAIVSLEHAGTSTIETIQSMLLLGYFYYCIGDWDKAWVLTSSAARMAIDVRLMQPAEVSTPMSTSTSYPGSSSSLGVTPGTPDDTQRRHRTWGVSLVLNTLLSARMGRSPVIRMSDWLEIKIAEDGWEEWDAWTDYNDRNDHKGLYLESGRCLSTFNHLMSIMSVLNLAITSTIDTVGISDNLFLPNVITLEYLQEKLTVLKESVPLHCKLPENVDSEIKQVPPYIVFVDMAFHLVVCIICIRLSEVEEDEGYKYTRAKRDLMYQQSVGRLQAILTSLDSTQTIRIPYIDYMMTICLGLPGLLPHQNTGDQVLKILQETSRVLVPCAIVQSIIDPGIDSQARHLSVSAPGSSDGDDPAPTIKDSSAMFHTTSLKSPVTNSPYAHNFPTPGLPSSNIYKFFESKVSSPVPGVGGAVDSYMPDDLEAFMLDINMNADNRQDKFLKNLGFVGTPRDWTKEKN